MRSLPAPEELPVQTSALKPSVTLQFTESDILALPDRDQAHTSQWRQRSHPTHDGP